jgi:hypothetical protein
MDEVGGVEIEQVRRHALVMILADFEGQAGAAKAVFWPILVAGVVGGSALIGWAVIRRGDRPTAA